MSTAKKLQSDLLLHESCREQYFSRIQMIYDLSLSTDESDSRDKFLSASETIDDIRQEFMNCLRELNFVNLQLNPDYKPNFSSWNAFEDLYCKIRRVKRSLVGSSIPKVEGNLKITKPKLPPIEIPEFNGNPTQWNIFYETFKNTIHNNKELNNSEKLYYLLGKLKDKAQLVFSGVSPNENNYETIWQLLVKKYQDKRLLASTFLDQIFDTKSLPNPATASQLEIFIDRYAAAIAALKDLQIPDLCDYIFIHFALKRLDKETSKAFEMSLKSDELPTYEKFINFVKNYTKIMQRTDNISVPNKSSQKEPEKRKNINFPKITHAYFNTDLQNNDNTDLCSLCNGSHDHMYSCKVFLTLSPEERFKYIKGHFYCTNCLSIRHKRAACRSTKVCRYCNLRHSSLIHLQDRNILSTMNRAPRNNSSSSKQTSHVERSPCAQLTVAAPASSQQSMSVPFAHTSKQPSDASVAPAQTSNAASGGVSLISADYTTGNVSQQNNNMLSDVLLGTARVNVTDRYGTLQTCRCIIDPGSQNHFITVDCCRKLGLTINQLSRHTVIKGLSEQISSAKGLVTVTFTSRLESDKSYTIEPLVLNRITDRLPTSNIDINSLEYLKRLPLADDDFATPGDIDILLGARLFIDLLLPGKVTGSPGQPSAFLTTLGFVVMGEIESSSDSDFSVSYLTTVESIHNDLSKFFELDDIKDTQISAPQDKQCEEFYNSTTTRDNTGRFIVGLPFKDNPARLGDSVKTATRRFLNLERKFKKSPAFKSHYDDVFREYINKGYLTEVPELKNCSEGYVLPHHGVLREDKISSKLRIVLDASAKSESGVALNDILHTGPPLQTNLFDILLNFRLFKIAVTADLRQMYLQIIVREQDRSFQQVIYRFDSKEPLQYYAFDRVCFGLCSSPYLAIRTVHELAKQEDSKYPLASKLSLRDLYMDDIASSFMSEAEAVESAKQLIDMFNAGGFEMVKWSSNSHLLLSNIPESHRLTDPVNLDKDKGLKILGMQWLPTSDLFTFNILLTKKICTKRNILSTIARLWDILGLVGPVIVYAKLLIKELWSLSVDWDDTPPDHIIKLWSRFQSELHLLSDLKIPRHLGVIENSSVKLLGFCDASEKAYGAVVYLHVSHGKSRTTNLVCSKSKVAPVKVVTLARLELCAALLLAKLIRVVYDNFSPRYNITKIYAFSDSTVTLHWIYASPHRFQTFVANRISQIQTLLPAHHFHHIAGIDNPSDSLSRGLTPGQLLDNSSWFNGPAWTNSDESQWPVSSFKPDTLADIPEMKSISLTTTATANELPFLNRLAVKYSSWSKLLRVVIYIYRFLKLLPRNEFTSAQDLNFAENKILSSLQSQYFYNELINLKSNKNCSKHIQRLQPFISEDGLIRVGGRLRNADLTFDHKHPILLPKRDHIVNLIIDHYHKLYCHTGPNLLLSLLRQRFWIISGRIIVRSRIGKCNFCFRAKPKPVFPLMADLPPARVQRVPKAFINTGCDYAGPLNITLKRGRGMKSQKAYICLFVCMTTRAIHIELVSDLSTATFISAYKRFLSRRGPISVMYTDNGTNFIGAKSYLREVYKLITSEPFKSKLAYELSEYKIEWKFIPPNAPHMGAWESMIKSVKSHLFRVIGAQILTYEEMTTILCQIENIINSRPLCTTLSQDPSEPEPITPNHFLTYTSLKFLPNVPSDDRPDHLLERYQLLDRLVQSFWDKWSLSYLSALQARQKWNVSSPDITLGTVVIVMQDGKVSPLQWELGIITHLHPGKDGIVRVVTVKTSKGSFKRPTVRLCPLPTQ